MSDLPSTLPGRCRALEWSAIGIHGADARRTLAQGLSVSADDVVINNMTVTDPLYACSGLDCGPMFGFSVFRNHTPATLIVKNRRQAVLEGFAAIRQATRMAAIVNAGFLTAVGTSVRRATQGHQRAFHESRADETLLAIIEHESAGLIGRAQESVHLAALLQSEINTYNSVSAECIAVKQRIAVERDRRLALERLSDSALATAKALAAKSVSMVNEAQLLAELSRLKTLHASLSRDCVNLAKQVQNVDEIETNRGVAVQAAIRRLRDQLTAAQAAYVAVGGCDTSSYDSLCSLCGQEAA